MITRVVYGQPFGGGVVVGGVVGRDQRHQGETGVLLFPVDFEGGRELHGVIGAERMRIGQPHGVVEQGWWNFENRVTAGQMLAGAIEDRRRLGGGEIMGQERRVNGTSMEEN